VAALTDGPDSPVIGKARVRTNPVIERKGIIWIWMGEKAPVAPEEDIPVGLERARLVNVLVRKVYGNWRWHIENPSFGHVPRLHRSPLRRSPNLHHVQGSWTSGERISVIKD
jgi:phenylpropionate dioxygenase-like ring-hydroxylating dioxygenase large terminal subunit